MGHSSGLNLSKNSTMVSNNSVNLFKQFPFDNHLTSVCEGEVFRNVHHSYGKAAEKGDLIVNVL